MSLAEIADRLEALGWLVPHELFTRPHEPIWDYRYTPQEELKDRLNRSLRGEPRTWVRNTRYWRSPWA